MANAFVQTLKARGGGTTCTSGAPGVSTTAGNLLVVIGGGPGNIALASCTDSAGNTYTRASTPITWSWYSCEIYYCFNAASVSSSGGSWTITRASGIDLGMVVLEYSGLGAGTVSQAHLDDAGAKPKTAVTTATTGSAAAGDLVVVGSCTINALSAITAGYNTRESTNTGVNPTVAAGDLLSASAASQSCTLTHASNTEEIGGAIVCFTPAGAAAGQPTTKRMGGVPFMGQHGAGFPSAMQRW